MRITSWIICSLLFVQHVRAQTGLTLQQDVMPASLNPALQGMSEGLSAALVYNAQWVGITGAPTLAAISGAYRFKRHSAGLWLVRDAFGRTTLDEVHLQYAYHLPVGEGQLTGGIEGYFQQQTYNLFSPLHIALPDPAVSNKVYTSSNISAGIAYSHTKGYFGLSAQHMLNRAHTDDMFAHPSVIIYATGLYVYNLSEQWKILPGLTYRLPVGSPVVLYAQGHVQYNEKVQLDVGYRNAGAYQVGMRWNVFSKWQFWYCYQYDAAFEMSSVAGGHEVGLRFGTSFY